MRTQRFVIGIVLGASLAVTGGNVEAKNREFHAHFAGTETNKDDLSFTGTTGAGYATVAGKSTLGEYTAQMVGDFEPDGQTCTASDGGSGFALAGVAEVFVLSFTATGEQLFLNLSPVGQVGCCSDNPSIGCIAQISFAVTGGTGRFAGATGTIVKTVKVIGLPALQSPSVKGGFDSFSGTFDGTIELAK